MPLQPPKPFRHQMAAHAVADKVGLTWQTGLSGLPARLAPSSLERCVLAEVEERRLFLWLPVAFGAGILLYFAAEREPTLWAPVAAGLVTAIAAVLLRRHWRARAALLALTGLFAGFAAAAWRTHALDSPVLQRTMIGTLTGRVLSVEERLSGARILVEVASFARLGETELPRRVRLTTKQGAARAGDFIEATARLMPPPGAARPGGYDFSRDAFFAGIGAVGSVSGGVKVKAPPAPPDRLTAFAIDVDNARNLMTKRIAAADGTQAGAVAAALVTGKRGLISEDTNEALRAAGIYHIVSISGLHMALAAGTFFWFARALLALVPAAVIAWPVKKIAALVGMAGATAYCVFSGSEVATERSLIMVMAMMGAILFDRPALSMRNLAIAALVCLAREPEALLGPSFQMSFAAVAGMIAFCAERNRAGEGAAPRAPAGPAVRALRAVGRWLGLLIATTAVATIATAPFSAYHFQTLNPLGLLGNGFALPLIELVVMPLSVLGVLATPFGLDGPVWRLMGLATAPVLAGAQMVAGLDRSSVIVPAFGGTALGLMALGILWTTLWASALRWLAFLPAGFGLALAAHPERPDVYIDRNASGAAVRSGDGRLVVLGRPSAFVLAQWLKADGDGRSPDDPTLRTGARCDGLGCVVLTARGAAVAFVTDKAAFAEDCGRATIVISPLRAPSGCSAASVHDRASLARSGAVAVTISDNGLTVRTDREPGISRPWAPALPATPVAALPSAANEPAAQSAASDPADGLERE